MIRLSVGASIVALMALSGCQGDPNEAANALMVEMLAAQKEVAVLTDASNKDEVAKRIKLLEGILASSKTIVDDYPEANLALEISSKGAAQGIEFAAVEKQLELARRDLTCFDDAVQCMVAIYSENIDTMLANARQSRNDAYFVDFGLSILARHYHENKKLDEAKATIDRIENLGFRFDTYIDMGQNVLAQMNMQEGNAYQLAKLALGFQKSDKAADAPFYAKQVAAVLEPASGFGEAFNSTQAALYVEYLYGTGDNAVADAYVAALFPAMVEKKASAFDYLTVLKKLPEAAAATYTDIAFDAMKDGNFAGPYDALNFLCLAEVAGRSGEAEEIEGIVFTDKAVEDTAELGRAPEQIVTDVAYGLIAYLGCPSKTDKANAMAEAAAEGLKERYPVVATQLLVALGRQDEAYAFALNKMRGEVEANNFGETYNRLFATIRKP